MPFQARRANAAPYNFAFLINGLAMPIYAYRCASCGHSQDVLQKMSDAQLSICPACGESAYTKQLTAAGFQLKGSGLYVNDFREGGGKKAAKPEAEGDGSGDKAVETAGEKVADKAVDKTVEKSTEKSVEKTVEKSDKTAKAPDAAAGKAADKSTAAAPKTVPAATPPRK